MFATDGEPLDGGEGGARSSSRKLSPVGLVDSVDGASVGDRQVGVSWSVRLGRTVHDGKRPSRHGSASKVPDGDDAGHVARREHTIRVAWLKRYLPQVASMKTFEVNCYCLSSNVNDLAGTIATRCD